MTIRGQERSQRRHEKILDAALSVFARKGYSEAAVDDIAAQSRTSKGGVYFHFPGKQAIFLALLDRSTGRLREKIEEALASETDPIAKADAALRAVLRTFSRHRTLARFFLVEAFGAGREFHERLARIDDELIELIKTHLDDAVASGLIEPLDTEVAARAWFGALNAVLTHWVLAKQPPSLEATYEALLPLLMRSVGARQREAIS
jgi:AcrR family transcriptional regulator